MINGVHTILFSSDAEADRVFLRDVLSLDSVDAGGGWLIFKSPPGEIAVHPETPAEPAAPEPATDGPAAHHELFLMCDDLDVTLSGLAARGVEVNGEPRRERWGVVAEIRLPSGSPMGIYQPAHPTAHGL
ncbi:VOC family protein [Hamadaea tsunoensis]|uniref:VOC family protein n=1 Tax=Hamadaea tsunoensis TaxID=53368 RepID=UPI00048226C7|nr:VOC family protein [Hamadaea tsunoensis]